jgi:hypothetical protein
MTEKFRSAVSHQLTLHRAHSAARAGDLDLAGRLLDSLDPSVASLDLRARVHAQRGEFGAAEECWVRVLSLAPKDRDALAGRAALARIFEGGRVRPRVHTGQVALVAAAVVVLALVGGVAWVSSSAPLVDSGRLQAETQRADSLQQKLSALEADRGSAVAARGRALDSIAAGLRMSGVVVERRADDVRVVFDAGVFPAGTEVTASGRDLLGAVGRRLAGMSVSTTVVGHAVAVAGGRVSGGSTVAFSRAQVAATYLAAGGSLTDFKLASADQADGPFPDAARNRTVTLIVVPR